VPRCFGADEHFLWIEWQVISAEQILADNEELEDSMDFSGLNGSRSPLKAAMAMALWLALSPAAFGQQNSTDVKTKIKADDAAGAALKQLLDTYTEAWNRHDSHALAMLFTEDCDYVIVSGGNTHGREALEKSFGNNFNSNLKDSTRTDSIRRTRFLTPDIVSLDDYWVLNVPGADRPRREGYYTWILIRENGRWLIALHHAAQFPDPQPAPGK
jgi:uncharacterized protein (TIGR02246 family)